MGRLDHFQHGGSEHRDPVVFNEHLEVHPQRGMVMLGGKPLPAQQAHWVEPMSDDPEHTTAHIVVPLENGRVARVHHRRSGFTDAHMDESEPNSFVTHRAHTWQGGAENLGDLHETIGRWSQMASPSKTQMAKDQEWSKATPEDERYGEIPMAKLIERNKRR